MKIAILQGVLPEYRVPVFNRLCDFVDKICVFHTGQLIKDTRFNQHILDDKIVLKKFHFQKLSKENFQQYDILVIMFDMFWISYISLVFSLDKKVILWGQGLGNRSKKNIILNALKRLIAANADALLFYDDFRKNEFTGCRKDLINKSFSAYNTIYVPNHGRCESSIRNTFLFIGRIEKRKNLEFLLETFYNIVPQIPGNILLNIIGDGPYLEEVKRFCFYSKRSERVKILGKIVDSKLLKKYFDNAIAVVHPAPLGLVINHSFAYGVPVVSLKYLSHGPELQYLTSENSLLGTEAEFAINMIKLANEPDLANRLGQKAYKTYNQFCLLDRMIDGFENAIKFVS